VIQDADGDGKPDLLSLNDDLNSVQLFTNKSTPGETKQEYFNGGTSCKVVTIPDCIGDLDGDGRPDMIIGNYFGIDIYHSTPSLVIPPLIQPPVTEVTEDYLVLYPNPASTYTNVKYNLPARSDVLITVHNNFGKVMSSFKTGEQAAGDHINYIKTADLKMGIYVVTVSAGTYNKAGKLIIK
ncbi:MAG: T9SS type A sorting domain-containing protein, partial [Sphingobacteriaceae bacterium]